MRKPFLLFMAENSRLSPERHVQILHAFRDPKNVPKHVSLNFHPGYQACDYTSKHDLERQRYQEMALIAWLEDIGTININGKQIRHWLKETGVEPGDTTVSALARSFKGKMAITTPAKLPGSEEIVRSLFTICQDEMKFVVTGDRVLGMACAMAQPGDIVCLLQGTRPETPIILRRASEAMNMYWVVGSFYLAVGDFDKVEFPCANGMRLSI